MVSLAQKLMGELSMRRKLRANVKSCKQEKKIIRDLEHAVRQSWSKYMHNENEGWLWSLYAES